MKKNIFFLSVLFLVTTAFSQTQQGFVKTKGRMVNGQLVPGQGLKGATVSVQGRTAILVDADNGAFSFPIPAKTFMVQGVQKKGYQLVDMDAVSKSYNYSSNPIYLVMETPDQQLQDQLESERKIRRTLTAQLQEKEDEIEALKAQGLITQAQYQEALQQLYADQENNEKLIADMARQYAQLDYDQMDELNQRISDAILNGRLAEADSLLRSKGSMNDRIAEIRREQQVMAQRELEIIQAQKELADAQAGTQKKLEDIASDCFNYFNLCKLNMKWDSAAYYIDLRAQLDTFNAQWQFDAAHYFVQENQFAKALSLYSRALVVFSYLSRDDPHAFDPAVGTTLNNMAGLLFQTKKYEECEKVYLESLEIYRRLAQENPQFFESRLAITLINVATLYDETQRLAEGEKSYQEALEIYRRLAKDNPEVHEPELAASLNSLAYHYYKTKKYAESEKLYQEALSIRRRLAKKAPQVYDPDLANTLNDFGMLCHKTKRDKESEAYYLEALEIQRRLSKDNPQAYEPDLAATLNNLGRLYFDTKQVEKGEKLLMEALEILRRLAQSFPQTYGPELGTELVDYAGLYFNIERYAVSEQLYKEAVAIYRQLAQFNPQTYEPELAVTLYSLGLMLINTQRYDEAITYHNEAFELYRRLVKTNPKRMKMYEKTMYWLVLLYDNAGEHQKCYEVYEEYLPVIKDHYQSKPKSYRDDYAMYLNNQSHHCLFLGKYAEAEQSARDALKLDGSKTPVYVNLAAALLFQGQYAKAEKIYTQYKEELRDAFLQSLDAFEAEGAVPKKYKSDVERVRKILSEE